MVGQNPQQAHFEHSIKWPVTLDGSLGPARGSLVQYEFSCRDKASVNAKLPLDPYKETVSQDPRRRNKGLQITVQFNHHTVLGQFHRHPKNKPKGIWIYTNNRSNQGPVATQQWNQFVSRFGIRVGADEKTIPVYLDFHFDRLVVIRLRPQTGVTL